jgi:hypothetical protein
MKAFMQQFNRKQDMPASIGSPCSSRQYDRAIKIATSSAGLYIRTLSNNDDVYLIRITT